MGEDEALELGDVFVEVEGSERTRIVRPELGIEEVDGAERRGDETEEGWQILYLSAELVEEILYLCHD